MKNHALEHFRRPPQLLNCAQAVLYAYHQVVGPTPISLADMKRFGGGRAPGALWGALHAACVLAPDRAERLKAKFAEITGSVCCKAIRTANQHACESRVSESAKLLESELSNQNLG
jgi:hypothetical protein